MLSLDVLPADILLRIAAALSLQDAISLSMVNQAFYTLSQEHSFWLEPLRTTRIIQPIPCATTDDLTTRTTQNLKQLALHTLRLARNWRQPLPQITGPIKTFHCGVHNNILYCLPGTDAIVLYSLIQGTVICADVKTGATSTPMFVGRIFDMSSPLEELTSFTVAALVEDERRVMAIVVLTATIHPAVATRVVFTCDLDGGYVYNGIFMTSSVVGVARGMRGGTIEVQSFNLLRRELSTIVVTDRPPQAQALGSTVIGDTVYFIILQSKDAFVEATSHASPPPPNADADALPPALTRLDYCVLSTEPNHGRNTISVARNVTTDPLGRHTGHSLEITFWPRPSPSGSEDAGEGDEWERKRERERAEGRKMQPAQTICIPGSLSNQPGTAWELLVIANSGLEVVLVVDPPSDVADAGPPANGDGDGDGEELEIGRPPTRPPAPKLLMARYDPLLHSVSLHELQIPLDKEEPNLSLDTRGICALALDDHRGYVIVVTVHNVLHYIPYA
ncbi:F-box domain-containing protein [Mycena venus]|uniref:F-box domain-containing protein n=1 Tax=Mycena venus TaxID=2733690 RepID=A0A8H7D5Q3_9AGAR|nr:F-box domain-containing protein [Mycena venus]